MVVSPASRVAAGFMGDVSKSTPDTRAVPSGVVRAVGVTTSSIFVLIGATIRPKLGLWSTGVGSV